MSRVIVVKWADRNHRRDFTTEEYKTLIDYGLRKLAGSDSVSGAVSKCLPVGVIGFKTNCLARKFNSTPVALCDALAETLGKCGFEENDIIIWDRSNDELEKAGFKLNASSFGRRCFGTNSNGVGYSRDFYSSGKVNSLVSRILTDLVNHNINLPILKDHSIAGLSGGLKNMYGAINNPNKYHIPNCDPYAAHISNLKPIKSKNRLTIIDAVRIQYHFGPGFDNRYLDYYNGLILSDDPVAADRVALEILEYFRRLHNLPSLEQDNRPVKYLDSASAIGLGESRLENIIIDTAVIDSDGRASTGELL